MGTRRKNCTSGLVFDRTFKNVVARSIHTSVCHVFDIALVIDAIYVPCGGLGSLFFSSLLFLFLIASVDLSRLRRKAL